MKTSRALCGLISGLLLLAAGTAQTHAGLLVPAAPGAHLYVANFFINTIERLTPGGVGSVFAHVDAQGLAFDSAGNLYATSGSTIEKFTRPGGTGSVFASTGLNGPRGLAFDSAGNLYAANSDNTIEKFTPGGTGSVFASTGLNGPTGLAFDSAGNLYAANKGDSTIEKFSPGGVGSVFANTGSIYGGGQPVGLAFDSAGNLYAANFNYSTIEEFSSTGTDLGVFAGNFGGLNGPTYLAFAPVPEPVPEPGTALFGIACAGVAAFRRRRR